MTVFVVLLSALTAAVATGMAIALLRRRGVLDVANERSSHAGTVPRGGGIGVVSGFAVGLALAGFVAQSSLVLVVAVILGLVGLIDDVHSLSAYIRLSVQLAIGVVVAGAVAIVSDVGQGTVVLVTLVGAIWFAGFVNAFNFMDGINGISGLSAIVAGAWSTWVGASQEVPGLEGVGLALVGSAMGFLPWNVPRARVFLGDVGSYAVGAIIATTALLTIVATGNLLLAVAPCAVYAADTAWTLVQRKARGESLTTAHRDHAYQRLTDQWHSHILVALMVAGCSIVLCLLAGGVSPRLATPLGILVVLFYLSAPRWAGRRTELRAGDVG